MSFYQKIWSGIAATVIGITFAIAFVCIDGPYTKWFEIGLGAIVLAEVMACGSWIRVLGAKERNLPFNMAYTYPWWLYFLFALLILLCFGLVFLFRLEGFRPLRRSGRGYAPLHLHHLLKKVDENFQKLSH